MEVIDNFTGYYAFLSNFYFSPELPIYGYPSMEHYFQAMKNKDPAYRHSLKGHLSCGAAKKLGRATQLREDWEDIKDSVMLVGLRAKFSYPSLRTRLVDTGLRQLIEGNTWHDNYWGVCYCGGVKCQGATNKLGYFLMVVRLEVQ